VRSHGPDVVAAVSKWPAARLHALEGPVVALPEIFASAVGSEQSQRLQLVFLLESEVQELREQVEECMEYIQQHMTNVTMACEFRGSTTTPTWRQQGPTDCSLCEPRKRSKASPLTTFH